MTFQGPKLKALALIALFLATTNTCLADEKGVHVLLDQAKIFRIPEPARTVVIGNPMIADVSMQDTHTVLVTGKAYGKTNLIILDESNEPIIDEIITVGAANNGMVTVMRNGLKQTYSCAPDCQPALRLGDSKEEFKEAAAQVMLRNGLITGEAKELRGTEEGR